MKESRRPLLGTLDPSFQRQTQEVKERALSSSEHSSTPLSRQSYPCLGRPSHTTRPNILRQTPPLLWESHQTTSAQPGKKPCAFSSPGSRLGRLRQSNPLHAPKTVVCNHSISRLSNQGYPLLSAFRDVCWGPQIMTIGGNRKKSGECIRPVHFCYTIHPARPLLIARARKPQRVRPPTPNLPIF